MIGLEVLLFMMPIVLAGMTNMGWVKLPIVKRNRVAMDGGRCWRDGKPVFGANKTWAGFWGMIVFAGFWFGMMGIAAENWDWLNRHSLLPWDEFSPGSEWLYGMLWGFAYVLFELPNSFIKRRIDIAPGQNDRGLKGLFFTMMDQVDSVIGCILATYVFYHPSIMEVVLFLVIGSLIHYVVNVLLYVMKLKNQAR
ncbi:CDP-archaeol synthase [Marinicrinis sediminis]|uniref:CDP-archaeol synthase n=1 Tax=Marinicrinis sediminis TaxID=1652465 RepID=A0ABW5RBL6_9BACL